MAEKKPQTLANHARFDPLFHFVLAPILILTVIGGLIHLVRRPSFHSASFFVLSVVAVLMLTKMRMYSLKVQDRVIRLEERLRLSALSPESFRPRITELTEDQLVALRFASDGEVVALAQRALSENLSRVEIKKAIQIWRPDYWRV